MTSSLDLYARASVWHTPRAFVGAVVLFIGYFMILDWVFDADATLSEGAVSDCFLYLLILALLIDRGSRAIFAAESRVAAAVDGKVMRWCLWLAFGLVLINNLLIYLQWEVFYALAPHVAMTHAEIFLPVRLWWDDGLLGGAADLVLVIVLAPLIEEFGFRGYALNALTRRIGWWTAAIVSSTLFALLHYDFVDSFVFALVLSFVVARTGSIVTAILVHAIYNAITSVALLWISRLGEETTSVDPQIAIPMFVVGLLIMIGCLRAIPVPSPPDLTR